MYIFSRIPLITGHTFIIIRLKKKIASCIYFFKNLPVPVPCTDTVHNFIIFINKLNEILSAIMLLGNRGAIDYEEHIMIICISNGSYQSISF